MKIVGSAAIGVAISMLGAPASAATTTLDFSGNICGVTGNEACGNGSQIGQNYGDGTGVDVGYRSVTNATGDTYEPFLKYWSTAYGDLTGVVWGGFNADVTYSEMTFTALAGYELTLLGFDAGCYQNRASCQNFPFSIQEIGGGVVASGTNSPLSGQHVSQAFGLGYSAAGYVLRWGPDGYDGGLDNITFDVRQIVTGGGGVPEPATWALMILGFGAVGGAMRRRSTTARLTLAA